MKLFLLIGGLIFGGNLVAAADSIDVLFIIGDASHGWNEHEFPQSTEVLATCLEETPGLDIQTTVHQGAITSDMANRIADADVVVLYSDGEDLHVAHGQSGILRLAWEQGTGLVVLHYSLDTNDPELSQLFLDATGGTFEVDWSVNPIWTLENPDIHVHEVTAGVTSFSLKDEWYYHMRFREGMRNTVALLSAHPPQDSLGSDGPRTGNPAVRNALKEGIPQILAWASEQPGEVGRGFATTGGHYHHGWNNDSFRTLVLNGIVWSARGKVPEGGVSSQVRGLVEHQTLGKAIALGDADDIRRHLERDPLQLNKPIRGDFTALHMAILRRKPESALALLAAGADPNLLTGSQQTGLHLAAERNLPELVLPLVEAGVTLSALDHQGWTALHIAAAKDQVGFAKQLLMAGAGVDTLSGAGGSPLHEAAPSASVEMAQILVAAGVDLNLVSDHGVTALDLAKEFKNDGLVDFLTEVGGR